MPTSAPAPAPAHKPSLVLFSSLTGPVSKRHTVGSASLTCPACGRHSLKRVHRRAVDRFLGTFVTLRRFACRATLCQWEGNLTKGVAKSRSTQAPRLQTVLLIGALLALMVGTELLRS